MKHRARCSIGRAIAVVVAALLALTALPARATPNFPGAVQRTLGAVAAPDCSICHVNGRVGRGTVNTGFGTAMRARGLVLYDEGSLAGALAAMEVDRVDSDGDGVIDVDAIRRGNSPNGAGEAALPDETIPSYGCFGRVAPRRPSPDAVVPGLALVAFAVLAARRRGRGQRARPRAGVGPWLTLFALCAASGGASACASGAALAPRTPTRSAEIATPMKPIAPSAFETDLRAAGLDITKLPPFESLAPWQVRRVMGTFTRALGFACTDCHDRQDHRAPTRAKVVAVRMWNEMTRPYAALDGGGAVYCDSCHQGRGKFLDRSDKKALSAYMSDNYAGKLKRADGKDVECETCHGEPFEGKFLSTW